MRTGGRRAGFTLIELMIVVAIIGALAAIAVPAFMTFQMRSKVAEGKSNIASIRTAEEAYFAERGTYVEARENPNNPTALKQIWQPAIPGWDLLGWVPEGEVYFQYGSFTGAAASNRFNVEARSDLDGDGVVAEFAYIHPAPGAAVSLPLNFNTTCAPTGVFNTASGAQDLLNTVGSCTAQDGRSLF